MQLITTTRIFLCFLIIRLCQLTLHSLCNDFLNKPHRRFGARSNALLSRLAMLSMQLNTYFLKNLSLFGTSRYANRIFTH